MMRHNGPKSQGDFQGFAQGVIMKKEIAVLAVASLAILTMSAANAENKVEKGAEAVGHGAKKVGEASVDGVKKAGEATVSGAKKVGSGMKKGVCAVGTGIKKVGEGTVGGVKKAGGAVAEHMPGHHATTPASK
jgi:hypothetical protein